MARGPGVAREARAGRAGLGVAREAWVAARPGRGARGLGGAPKCAGVAPKRAGVPPKRAGVAPRRPGSARPIEYVSERGLQVGVAEAVPEPLEDRRHRALARDHDLRHLAVERLDREARHG